MTDETVKAVTPLAAAKGLDLTVDVPEDLVLQSDRRRVKQVLMNLLGNAIKFSDQGDVRVEVGAVREDELTVSVIRPRDRHHARGHRKLFSPFSRST